MVWAGGRWIGVLLVLFGLSLVFVPAASAVDSFPAPADVAIRIDTVPSGIAVEVDGVSRATPYAFVCPQDSVHFLNATNMSVVGDVRYVFTGWDDGMTSLSHSFVCDVQQNFTALYRTEYRLDFTTFRSGLRLFVGGSLRVAPFSVWCAEGSLLQVTAPSPQDGIGAQHTFTDWSDGGAASHMIDCDGPGSYTAGFLTQYLISLFTSPNGLTVTVDGTSFASPYTFWCVDGAFHIISVPSTQGFQGQQLSFADWSDRGERTHTIWCDQSANYTASFIAVPTPPTESTPSFVFLWVIVLVVIIVVVLVVVGVILVMRSSDRRRIVVVGVPPAPPAVIPQPSRGPAAAGMPRLCPRCGRSAEADWTYCAACAAELR